MQKGMAAQLAGKGNVSHAQFGMRVQVTARL